MTHFKHLILEDRITIQLDHHDMWPINRKHI